MPPCWRRRQRNPYLRDLKVNSARLVDIIIKCEDVFGTSIDDDEADKIATIGDAVTLIQQKAA